MKNLTFILLSVIILVSCESGTTLEQPSSPKLIKILTYSSSDKNAIKNMTTFEYDNSGNLAKETFFFNDTIYPLIYSIFEYENGKKIHEDKYNAMGDRYNLSQKYTFIYNGNLLIKEELRFQPNDIVSNYTEYKYDTNNNLILESRVQVDPYFKWDIAYVFDSANAKVKTIYYDEHSNIVNYTKHYYQNKLLSNEKVFDSENKLFYEYNYNYDSNGHLIEITKTIAGETKVIELIHYQDSLIDEKTIYTWDYNRGLNYSLLGFQVYEYK